MLSLRRQPLHGSVIEKSNSDNYVPDVLLGRVAVADINLEGAQHTERLVRADGGEAQAVQVDITQFDAVACSPH